MASSSTSEGGSRSKPSSPRGSWFKAMFRSKSSTSLVDEGEEERECMGKPPLPSRAGGGDHRRSRIKQQVCVRMYRV